MASPDYAHVLLTKAAQDEFTLRKLAPDPGSPDEVMGFHAQQAVEKLLKAVLSSHGIDFRRTHDLVELIDLLADNDVSYPPIVETARRLNPFATVLRYDVPPAGQNLDRQWAIETVCQIRQWAQDNISGRA